MTTAATMKIHKEGHRIILTAGLILISLNVLLLISSGIYGWRWAFTGSTLLLFLWIIYFFRNPSRGIESSELELYAPADGTVVVIEKTFVREYFGKEMIQVSIFMSAFNIHVNRYPISGQVKYTSYAPGKHLAAFLPKSSSENEHCTTVVSDPQGREVMIRQIAGAMARRIVNYARESEPAVQGHELGFIKFGSRVDLFLPADCTVLVGLKQKVRGGETVIARFAQKK